MIKDKHSGIHPFMYVAITNKLTIWPTSPESFPALELIILTSECVQKIIFIQRLTRYNINPLYRCKIHLKIQSIITSNALNSFNRVQPASLTKCSCAVNSLRPTHFQQYMLDKVMLVEPHPNVLFLDHQQSSLFCVNRLWNVKKKLYFC